MDAPAPPDRERARTRRTRWHVWYPLRRKGAFAKLEPIDQGHILREHAALGMAYGQQELAHDVRLACHGIDAGDNEFVIGLVGKDLHPLSHLVQAMRKTRQTSEFIEKMGPFFVGYVLGSSSGDEGDVRARCRGDSVHFGVFACVRLRRGVVAGASPPAPCSRRRRRMHRATVHGHVGSWCICGIEDANERSGREEARRGRGDSWGARALGGRRLSHERARAREARPRARELRPQIVHWTPKEVRYSCIADGAAAHSGASLGKLNLSLVETTADNVLTVYRDKKSGKSIALRPTASFRERYADTPRDEGARARSRGARRFRRSRSSKRSR